MAATDLAGVIIRVPRREGSALCPCVGVRKPGKFMDVIASQWCLSGVAIRSPRSNI